MTMSFADPLESEMNEMDACMKKFMAGKTDIANCKKMLGLIASMKAQIEKDRMNLPEDYPLDLRVMVANLWRGQIARLDEMNLLISAELKDEQKLH